MPLSSRLGSPLPRPLAPWLTRLLPIGAAGLASLALVGCPPTNGGDDDDAPSGVPILGGGSNDLSELDVMLIADSSDGLDVPRDLDFHPGRDNELWIVNRGDESLVIIQDTASDDQMIIKRRTASGHHFLAQPSGLSFSTNGNFATIHETDIETQGPVSQGGSPADFMGPTLYSSDLNLVDGGHGGHLDMLHASPNGMGIECEGDNAFWVFNGDSSSLDCYDFHGDHGPGGADHSDGEVGRYVEGEVDRMADVPSHMAYDPDSGLLYIADTGNHRIAVLDTESGDAAGSFGPNYDGGDQYEVEGADIRTLVDGDDAGFADPSGLALRDGVLYVSDNQEGNILALSLEGELLDWLDVGSDNGDLMGIEFGEDGSLYFVDAGTEEILRLSLAAE